MGSGAGVASRGAAGRPRKWLLNKPFSAPRKQHGRGALGCQRATDLSTLGFLTASLRRPLPPCAEAPSGVRHLGQRLCAPQLSPRVAFLGVAWATNRAGAGFITARKNYSGPARAWEEKDLMTGGFGFILGEILKFRVTGFEFRVRGPALSFRIQRSLDKLETRNP